MSEIKQGEDFVYINAAMRIVKCGCGTVYAVPWAAAGYRCPCCAGRQIARLEESMATRADTIRRLERTISGLRGALARRAP